MAEVFKRTEMAFGGAYTPEAGLIVPDAESGINGTLLQNINLQHQNQVSRVYEVGNANGNRPNVYFIQGRPQGQLSTQVILGPKLAQKTFYQKFSDVCETGRNMIRLAMTNAGCIGGRIAYTAKFCNLMSISLGTEAQGLVIQSGAMVQFANLDYMDG